MKQVHKYTLLATAILLFVGVLPLGFYWWAFTPHSEQTSGPISRETALKNHCPFSIPVGAHDIQYACSYLEMSPAFENFFRCEAPLAVCHALAKDQLSDVTLESIRTPSVPEKWSELKTNWFDPQRIAKGIAGGKGYGGQPRIWIDEKRGIFYYYLTD